MKGLSGATRSSLYLRREPYFSVPGQISRLSLRGYAWQHGWLGGNDWVVWGFTRVVMCSTLLQAKAVEECGRVLDAAARGAAAACDAADQLAWLAGEAADSTPPAHDVHTALEVLQTGLLRHSCLCSNMYQACCCSSAASTHSVQVSSHLLALQAGSKKLAGERRGGGGGDANCRERYSSSKPCAESISV